MQTSQLAFKLIKGFLFQLKFDNISNALARVAFLKSHFESLHADDWNFASKLVQVVYGEVSDVDELMNPLQPQREYEICLLMVYAKKFELASSIIFRIPVQMFMLVSTFSYEFSQKSSRIIDRFERRGF